MTPDQAFCIGLALAFVIPVAAGVAAAVADWRIIRSRREADTARRMGRPT